MNWFALRKSRCPQCNKSLLWSKMTKILTCKCGFSIGEQKMQQIIASGTSNQIEDQLNNEL